jgi:hypothetical protein
MRHRRIWLGAAILSLGFWLWPAVGLAQKKKKKDETTQVRELPKDPPPVALAETRKLVFHVSPLSGKGLLTAQTRDALRAILRLNGGLPLVHIRAFVAGSGDVRRIPQIVSEIIGEKKSPLPSVSILRAGGLPLENAQVVLEAISVAKRDAGAGLDILASEVFTDADASISPRALLQKAVDELAAKTNGGAAMVTCFVSTMPNPAELTAVISARFPAAAVNLVQPQRGPFRAMAVCESIGRGTRITADRLAFTGTRVAFGADEKDATLAFRRLDRDLNDVGANSSSIVFTRLYPLSGAVADLARKLRPSASPVLTIPVEGLASIDAGFAVDAVATVLK